MRCFFVKTKFFRAFFFNSNHSLLHFHGKIVIFCKKHRILEYCIHSWIFGFLHIHSLMHVDLSLIINLRQKYTSWICNLDHSRKVNRYQNICNSQNGCRLFFAVKKKEPHPKVIIASCATYQLWLKVTIKILPTIFFSFLRMVQNMMMIARFLQGVERPTYFGGLLSSDVIQT